MTDHEELVKLADEARSVALNAVGHVGLVNYAEREREAKQWVRNAFYKLNAALRRLASSDGVVKVRELEWRGPVDAFPTTIWEAKTPFGHYVIEEVSASDSPAYEVRFAGGHVISVKDGLNDAKAAAQADYEARIRSALVEVPAVKGEPVAWPSDGGCVRCGAVPRTASGLCNTCLDEDAERYENAPPADAGMREAYSALCLPRESQASDNLEGALYDIERLSAQGKPTDHVCIRTLKRVLKQLVTAEDALTAPGATLSKRQMLECILLSLNVDGVYLNSLTVGELRRAL